MYAYKPILINLLKKLGFLFIIYTLCRVLFFVLNHSYFNDTSVSDFFKVLLYGLRFDAFSIAGTNSLYILFAILPFNFYYHKNYQLLLKLIFIGINSLAIAFNLIDVAYFPYNQKRSTFEVFTLMFGGQTEFFKLLPHFLKAYWYLIFVFILLVWALVKLYNYINLNTNLEKVILNLKNSLKTFLLFIVIVFFTVLAIRGGLQRAPIVMLDAALYVKPQYAPLVLNTPFSILKTIELNELKPLQLIPIEEELKNFNPTHLPDTGKFKNVNVCVIILESFSKEFTGISNRKSYTPFLDSLMQHSLVFTNAYANGKTSIDGIPAILASMPSLMQDHYSNSIYSNNKLQTLPNLLKQKGYYSSFFHGGTNGTMNFNSFSTLAGFDMYYGRTEYNNDADYDGQWGIWDEPFLLNMVKQITTFKQPFFTSVFTLSSHNPYSIPKQYKNKFKKGNLEIIETIGYTDYALCKFFNEAKKQAWFKNTLFVLTADHTGISDDPFYANPVGQYSIPLLFYKNNELVGSSNKTVQQIDILPSILNYMNYNKPYFSFGKSVFSQTNTTAIYYSEPNCFVINDSLQYVLNNNTITQVYNFKRDSLLTTPIKGKDSNAEKKLQNYANAFIQNYTNNVLNNKTYYKK